MDDISSVEGHQLLLQGSTNRTNNLFFYNFFKVYSFLPFTYKIYMQCSEEKLYDHMAS